MKNLGAYSVTLTRIINNVQKNRKDSIKGSFVCYRGMSLPQSVIDKWTNQSSIELEGYSSATLSESIARQFAAWSETDDENQVLLKIEMENESGKHFISLDKPDITCYP